MSLIVSIYPKDELKTKNPLFPYIKTEDTRIKREDTKDRETDTKKKRDDTNDRRTDTR